MKKLMTKKLLSAKEAEEIGIISPAGLTREMTKKELKEEADLNNELYRRGELR